MQQLTVRAFGSGADIATRWSGTSRVALTRTEEFAPGVRQANIKIRMDDDLQRATRLTRRAPETAPPDGPGLAASAARLLDIAHLAGVTDMTVKTGSEARTLWHANGIDSDLGLVEWTSRGTAHRMRATDAPPPIVDLLNEAHYFATQANLEVLRTTVDDAMHPRR